jgi:hypothetical protein
MSRKRNCEGRLVTSGRSGSWRKPRPARDAWLRAATSYERDFRRCEVAGCEGSVCSAVGCYVLRRVGGVRVWIPVGRTVCLLHASEWAAWFALRLEVHSDVAGGRDDCSTP